MYSLDTDSFKIVIILLFFSFDKLLSRFVSVVCVLWQLKCFFTLVLCSFE